MVSLVSSKTAKKAWNALHLTKRYAQYVRIFRVGGKIGVVLAES